MNPLITILNLFKTKDSGQSEANKQCCEGYNAFERGKRHYLAGRDQNQEALDCFDKAIDRRFEEQGVYGMRGLCLQVSGFDLDAIDDFDKAIALEPHDSNLFFMRSLSKGAIGDLRGRVEDLQQAIRLSEIDSALNSTYNTWAKEHGYENIAAKYKRDLQSAQLDLEQQAEEERVRSKCPGLGLGPDLATRRRATARRRPTAKRGTDDAEATNRSTPQQGKPRP
jgi:tetratricopeptide (TPR) repeat protein